MTNDRAIEVLKAWDLNYQDEFTAHEFDEAFRMAIKALEQQDEIIQILDDYDLEAWEILEMIKEVVRT